MIRLLMFMLSMIAYEIITGKVPFLEEGELISPFTLSNKIIDGSRPKFTKNVSKKMRNLLTRCWSNEPSERPKYFKEAVDEEEIQYYLKMLSTSKEKRDKIKNKNYNENKKIKSLENELKKLKSKLNEIQNQKNKPDHSDCFLYSAITSILGEKNNRNIKKAVNDLQISSDQGNSYSSFLLGLLYESGVEIECNMKKAIEYYEKSIRDGNTNSIFRIGRCYQFGKGVKRDYNKAKEYFERSAELGNSVAKTYLRNLHVLPS